MTADMMALLRDMVEHSASDLHIKVDCSPAFRIDGEIVVEEGMIELDDAIGKANRPEEVAMGAKVPTAKCVRETPQSSPSPAPGSGVRRQPATPIGRRQGRFGAGTASRPAPPRMTGFLPWG